MEKYFKLFIMCIHSIKRQFWIQLVNKNLRKKCGLQKVETGPLFSFAGVIGLHHMEPLKCQVDQPKWSLLHCTNGINSAVKDRNINGWWRMWPLELKIQNNLRYALSFRVFPKLKGEFKGKHFNDLDGQLRFESI